MGGNGTEILTCLVQQTLCGDNETKSTLFALTDSSPFKAIASLTRTDTLAPELTAAIVKTAAEFDVTLSSKATARLETAMQGVVDALKDGNFSAVLDALAGIGGLPTVAVEAFQHVMAGQFQPAAEKMMTVASAAATPVLAKAIASITTSSGGVNGSSPAFLLTPEESSALAQALTTIGQCLVTGNFSGILNAVASIGGLPASAASAVQKVAQRDLDGAIKPMVPIATEAVTPV